MLDIEKIFRNECEKVVFSGIIWVDLLVILYVYEFISFLYLKKVNNWNI